MRKGGERGRGVRWGVKKGRVGEGREEGERRDESTLYTHTLLTHDFCMSP